MKTKVLNLQTRHLCGRRTIPTLAPGLFLLGLLSDVVHADTHTWDGGSASSGNWTVGANWVGGTAPVAGDSLEFPAGAARSNNTNNFAAYTAFGSLSIANGYTIRGNAVTLTGGVTGGGATFYPDIRLGADQTFTASALTLNFYGDVNLNGYNLIISGVGNHDLTGVISGDGNVTKTGSGTASFAGGENNTFTGATTVNQGTLELSKFVGLAIWGDLVIGDGSGGAGADVVVLALPDQIANSSDITINSSGLLTMNSDDQVHKITLNGGADLDTGVGTLTLGGSGGVTVNSYGAESTLSGKLEVIPGTCTFAVNEGAFYLSARVSGDANMVKRGGGVMYLSASNIFTGKFTIDEHWVAISHPWALGSSSAGTIVTNTGVLTMYTGMGVSEEPLTLAPSPDSSFAFLALAGSNWWAGPVTLSEDATVSVFLDTTLNISAPISGAGGLGKSGPGTLIVSGPSGNTYTGDTRVSEGTLELAKDVPTTAAAILNGSLFIGDGQGGTAADVVRYTQDDQVWSTVPIIITNSGLLDLNGHSDLIGALTFSGGRATSGDTGLIQLTRNVTTLASSSNVPSIRGNLYLSGNRTFTVANSTFSPDLNLFATISGDGMIKEGPGAISMYSNNVFTGSVTLNNGLLYFYHNNALGTTGAGTVVNDPGMLVPANGVHVGLEALTLNAGRLASIGGSNSWAGPVTLAADSLISVDTSGILNLSGVMSGAGGFNKTNAGTLLFSGTSANTFAGTAYVSAGTLDLAGSGAVNTIPGDLIIGDGVGGPGADVVHLLAGQHISTSSAITINTSGVLELVGGSDYIGSLSGSGAVNLNGNLLGVGYNGHSTLYAGSISGVGGQIIKGGAGTFTLTGNNSYTGLTTAVGGTLLVNGSQPASPVSVAAILGGTGTVGAVTSSGGTVSPGVSPGILHSAGVVLAAGSTLSIELNGLTPGSGHDQLSVQGLVQLTDVTLDVLLNTIPARNDQFLILANDGLEAILGHFTGLTEGAEFTAYGGRFKISYRGGSGNDVVLTVVEPPVPLRIDSIARSGNNVSISWSGGITNYILQRKNTLTNATWEPVSSASAATNALVPMDTSEAFFRVMGGQ